MAAGLALAAPARADVPIGEAARHHFDEGVRCLESKDSDRFERAYVEFKTAYANSPSWQVLGNLGIVAQELERYGEAIDAFRGYLEGGGKKLSSRERKQFKRDLSLLESNVATLSFQTDPDGAWIVDERIPDTGPTVVNRYGPVAGALELRVRPGHHRIRAELSGYSGATWELNPAAKTSAVHRFNLRPDRPPVEIPSQQASPLEHEARTIDKQQIDVGDHHPANVLRIGSYVTLGLGVVGLGVGTWFLLQSRHTGSDADRAFDNCTALRGTPGVCDVSRLNAMSQPDEYAVRAKHLDGRQSSQRNAALIGFVAGGALVASGLVLFLTSSEPDEASEARLMPWVGPKVIGVLGAF
jgi:hypothetical protein